MPSAAHGAADHRRRLEPLHGPPPSEVWFATGPVRAAGRSPALVRYAHDDQHCSRSSKWTSASTAASARPRQCVYAAMQPLPAAVGFPHLLRMWNYLDAINEGAGDLERYRQFCVGRAPRPAATRAPSAIPPRPRSDGSARRTSCRCSGWPAGARHRRRESATDQRLPLSARARPGQPELRARDGRAATARADLRHCEHRRPRLAAPGRSARTAR